MGNGRPDPLEYFPPEEYAKYLIALSVIRNQVVEWTTKGDTGPLSKIDHYGNLNPVTHIRNVLSQCPDEYPDIDANNLTFVNDKVLRESLWIDISSINRAIANQEWKAATILSGSIIEALLLWAIDQKAQPDIDTAIANAIQNELLPSNPKLDRNQWVLYQFNAVSHELEIITQDTYSQCELARNFRNFVHPGKATTYWE